MNAHMMPETRRDLARRCACSASTSWVAVCGSGYEYRRLEMTTEGAAS